MWVMIIRQFAPKECAWNALENQKYIKQINNFNWTTGRLEAPWRGLSNMCNVKEARERGKAFKKKKSGRPVSNSSNSVWTRAEIINLAKQTPEDILPDKFFVKNDDPQLALCKCKICDNTIRRPVLSACQHAFCLSCIIPKLEGKRQDDVECPVCHANILIGKLIPCTIIRYDKGMPKGMWAVIYKIAKRTIRPWSIVYWSWSVYTIKTRPQLYIFNGRKAALHVIRRKLSESTSPNNSIQFKTGGRVWQLIIPEFIIEFFYFFQYFFLS